MKTYMRIMIPIIAFVVVVGGSGGGYMYWHHTQVVKKEIAQRIAHEQQVALQRATYRSDLLAVAASMTSNAEQAQTACNDISQIWYNAIWDSGVEVNGNFDTDFNSAIADEEAVLQNDGTITSIQSTDTTIQSQMSKLNQPLSGFQQAYSDLEAAYQPYSDLVSQAETPSGSLTSYNTDINSDQSKFLSEMKMVTVDVPAK